MEQNLYLALSVLAITAFVATAIRTVKTKIKTNQKHYEIQFTLRIKKSGDKKGILEFSLRG